MVSIQFASLYQRFDAPISIFNCGEHCAPYNERGVPFCCDTHHAVPSAYLAEWQFLGANTSLWHEYQSDDVKHLARLRRELPDGQVMIECLGHRYCQRDYRSIVCRSFPFFPYITRQGEFIGFSYYWEYEDRCWVISSLSQVSVEFRGQFIAAYDEIFRLIPQERENFRSYSVHLRRVFGRRHRAIPLFHRNGSCYKVTPHNGRLRRVGVESLPAYGSYKIVSALPFPDERI